MTTTLSGFSVNKPSTAPTVVAGNAAGNLDTTAVYGYKVTFVTGFGETDGSTAGTVTTTSTGSANLSAIAVSTNGNVIARRIYRTVGGGSNYLLLAEIDDNITTTYTDIIVDSSLGAAIPTLNTAHSLQQINGFVKVSKPFIHGMERGIVATGTTIADAYQLSLEFNWIATTASGTGVKLPELNASLIGTRIKIRNNGANTLAIYPTAGQTINGGSAGASVNLATVTTAEYVADLAGNWQVI